jgi:hypothetical protein
MTPRSEVLIEKAATDGGLMPRGLRMEIEAASRAVASSSCRLLNDYSTSLSMLVSHKVQ